MSELKTLHPLSSEKQKRDTKRANGNEQVVSWFMKYLVNMVNCGLALVFVDVEPATKTTARLVRLNITLGPTAEKQLGDWFFYEHKEEE